MNDAALSSDQGAAGPLIPVLAVVGVGLIGGSFAAALRSAGQVGVVLGAGRNPQSLARARELGLIDEAVSLEEAAARADLILLATPVGGLADALSRMRAHLRAGAVLTDAGSTKAEVAAAARAALGERAAQFVPGHPIAGAERTGPEAAQADLGDEEIAALFLHRLANTALAQAEADVLLHREPREQRVALEHHAAVGAGADDGLAAQRDRPVHAARFAIHRAQFGEQFEAVPADVLADLFGEPATG